MAYKKFIVIQIEGQELKNLVVGCDAVAASLERKEMKRASEAPDKTGRYAYSVTDVPVLDFDDGLKKVLEANKTLADENAVLKQKIKDMEAKREETPDDEYMDNETKPAPEPEPEPKPQPNPNRMRTY